ncbi:MAG TPA: lipid-A-disaccharide synthase, partial [Myxococcota bacterium]|nr:lipid-A-disaccharide synthase [Myxococcota bacterium]
MKVFLSTADASGDLHAAALVEALAKRAVRLEAFGLGGGALAAAGFRPVVAQSEVAIAGLVEVLGRAPGVLGAYARLRRALVAEKPDLAVFVDSPDLNLPLASVAKRHGVPVLYYVAPQVWAWRAGRVRKLRRRTDRVAVIFPFEEPFLRAAGVRATFVGHPLVDRLGPLADTRDRAPLARELGLDPARPVLGLLPGSRHNEVERNWPLLRETAELLRASLPQLQVQLVVAPTLHLETFEAPEWLRVVRGRSHEAMAVSTCLVSAAGTATIEAAILGVPLVVAHRTSPLTFELARRLATVSSSCMVNLVAGEGVVPERIQGQARPAALASLVSHLLRDAGARAEMQRGLARAVVRLGPPGAAARVAELALQ